MVIFARECDDYRIGTSAAKDTPWRRSRTEVRRYNSQGKFNARYRKPGARVPKLVGVLTDDSLWSRLCLCSQTLKFIALFWSTCRPAYAWWIASKRFSSGTMARKTSQGICGRTSLDIFAGTYFLHRRKAAKTEFVGWAERWRAC